MTLVQDTVLAFNGKESDSEGEWGSLTHYDYGFRIYNPGIARFLSVDPLTHSYPWYTLYQFAGNKPIAAIDLDGLEEEFAFCYELDQDKAKLKSESFQTIFSGLTHAAENFASTLPNEHLSLARKISIMNNLVTIGDIARKSKKVDGSNEQQVQQFNEETSASLIGMIVGFANPILGWSTGTLIMDATKEDGLTNLDNDRMTIAFSQGPIQNKAGNYHYQ